VHENANATLLFNEDISHIMTDETALKQYIYNEMNVSDARMALLL
jgi:hypothetical protein